LKGEKSLYLSGSWFDWAKNLYMSFYNALVPNQRYLSYLHGLEITLLISLFAVIIGILIGILVAVLKVAAVNYKMRWLKHMQYICQCNQGYSSDGTVVNYI